MKRKKNNIVMMMVRQRRRTMRKVGKNCRLNENMEEEEEETGE